jgi:hypothetical protein
MINNVIINNIAIVLAIIFSAVTLSFTGYVMYQKSKEIDSSDFCSRVY